MRLAVIFDNFGPYHLARLEAAARVGDLLAVEVSPRSADYAWTNDATRTAFRRVTLLEKNSGGPAPVQEVSRRLNSIFSQFAPQAVAVPGWSSRAAFSALGWCADHGVPAIAMSESTTWDEDRIGWKEWIKRRIVRLSSSALVGGSPHRDYIVQLGMAPDRVFMGYDAVDSEYFANKTAEVMGQKSEVRSQTPVLRGPWSVVRGPNEVRSAG